MFRRFIAGVLCLSLFLAGCHASMQPPSSIEPLQALRWEYADLRLIDPVDAGSFSQDLIAGYVHWDRADLVLRFDFLELAELPDYDLYLALDIAAGGSVALPIQGKPKIAWEALFKIPAHGEIEVFPPIGKTEARQNLTRTGLPSRLLFASGLRVQRDPLQDAIVIRLNRSSLGNNKTEHRPALQAWLTQPGETTLIDELGPLWLDAQPPPPAQAVLVFWNSFPAYTPLQTLRRWDGAHTGPNGGRHGLAHLLRAARQTQTPLILLDLFQPASLAALDLVDQDKLVAEMTASDLLSLTQVVPGFTGDKDSLQPPAWALNRLIQLSKENANSLSDFEANGWFLQGGITDLPPIAENRTARARQVAFVAMDADTSIGSNEPILPAGWNNWTILTLPCPGCTAEPQADRQGLTLDTRRALINTALSSTHNVPGASGLLLLGGDLPASAWGNPQIARAAMRYIHNHPWIRMLRFADLTTLATGSELSLAQTSTGANDQIKPLWLERLERTPDNNLGLAAWHGYQAVYAPVFPTPAELAKLRSLYAGQINVLIEASHWADKPYSAASCDNDLDLDGEVECVLASNTVLAVFEKDLGGGLTFLFIRDKTQNVHQVVAPSSILINGISPEGTWDFEAGLFADPDTFLGGFFNQDRSLDQQMAVVLYPNEIRFLYPDQTIKKGFNLLPDGIRASIVNSAGDKLSPILPITLDPWRRFDPGWFTSCKFTEESQFIRWSCAEDIAVEITCDAAIQHLAATDDLDRLESPENPDQDIQAGQRLPYPLAVMKFQSNHDLACSIRLQP